MDDESFTLARTEIAWHWNVDARNDVHIINESAHGGWVARVDVCTLDGRTLRFSETALDRATALERLVKSSEWRAVNAGVLTEWRNVRRAAAVG